MNSQKKGVKYVVSLRRHIFRAPNWILSLTLSSISILLLSFLIHPVFYHSLLLFLAPYLLTILLDHVSIKAMRVYFPLRRITALNLFAFFISFIQFWILSYFYSFKFAFFLSFSSVVFIRYMIYRAFLSEHKIMAGTVSSFYSLSILLLSLNSWPYIYRFILTSLIYGIMAYVFIGTTTVMFRREFREDPLFFVASFVNYASRNTGEDVRKLNNFFHSIYGNRRTPVSTMVFYRNSKVKSAFIVPYVHPGPFGEVGGSNLPNKIERYTGMGNLMVFHSTTTHDNNIASEEDVKKIANAIKESIRGDCKYNKMSDLHRFEINGIQYAVQLFGKYAFIAMIPHKGNFDDVELKTGMMIRRKIREFLDDAVVVDAHNNFNPDALALSLTQSDVSRIVEEIKKIKADKPIRMGVGFKKLKGESIGEGGIRVAVFEYGKKKIAYVLFDGNNVKRGLRDEIRKALKEYVDDAEVFSTDNHIVNMSMIDHNPVGERDSWNEIIEATIESLKAALENIEDVCVKMSTKFVEVRMAFSGELQKLTEITKASLGMAKITAPLTFLIGFFLSYFVFSL